MVWDNLGEGTTKSLSIKTLQYCVGVYINMTVIKYFPLTIVAMADNCAPFLVMIFAFFCIPSDPTVNLREFLATLLAVVGTILIVQGNAQMVNSGAIVVPVIGYILLVLKPLTAATGRIYLRLLKKIDAVTI